MYQSKEPTIDTCDIYIPVSEVTFPSESPLAAFFRGDLIETITFNATTGEELFESFDHEGQRSSKRRENAKHRVEIDFGGGVSMYVNPAQYTRGKGVSIPSVRLELSAKQLGIFYLQGITRKNVRLIYDIIQASGVIAFSFETFLQAPATDVDFKLDFFFKDKGKQGHPKFVEGCDVIERQFDAIEARTKAEIIVGGPARFNRYKLGEGSQSITYNHRGHRIKKSIAKDRQHLMFYNKTLDLMASKSYLFNEAFNILDQIQGGHLLRVETNISCAAYLRAMGYNGGLGLGDYLNFEPDFKLSFFSRLPEALFVDSQKVIKVKPNEKRLPWSSIVLLRSLMQLFKDHRGDIDLAASAEAKLYALDCKRLGLDLDRKAKSAYKARCKALLEEYFIEANDEPFQTSFDSRLQTIGVR
jgi:hypothetical protein